MKHFSVVFCTSRCQGSKLRTQSGTFPVHCSNVAGNPMPPVTCLGETPAWYPLNRCYSLQWLSTASPLSVKLN